VTRFSPEKEVGLADTITVAFNHPMVPLSSLARVEDAGIPVTIEPAIEGRFVWVGTDTIALKMVDRLPFANRFTVTVPAGTRSALGGVMEKPFSWSFETPRPELVSSNPSDAASELGLDIPITLEFNAAIELTKVMLHLKLVSAGGTAVPLELVGRKPGKSDAGGRGAATGGSSRVAESAEGRSQSRSITVRPALPLKPGTRYDLSVAPEMTCSEGPLPMGTRKVITFRTYDPVEPRKVTCGWDDSDCSPGSDIRIEFNNTLKELPLDGLVKVSPAPEKLAVRVSGTDVLLSGMFQPSTRYEVEVLPGVQDIHGQVSSKSFKGSVRFGQAWPMLDLVRQGLAVVEAEQPHDFMLTRLNVPVVNVRMVPVPLDRLAEAVDVAGDWFSFEDQPLKDLKAAVERPLPPPKQLNLPERIALDLDEALGGKKTGIVFVDVKGTRPRGLFKGNDTYRQTAMVQVTDLGLTAAQSDDALHVLVTRLSTGKPVLGVRVELFRGREVRPLSSAESGENGIAILKGPAALPTGEAHYYAVAGLGDDVSFLPLSGWGDAGSHVSSYSYAYGERYTRMAGMVYTERGLYRPAEKVHVGVVTRGDVPGPQGDIIPLPSGVQKIGWRITDPRGNEVGTGEAVLSRFGTGDFEITLPKDAPLGDYDVNVWGLYGTLSAGFDVQEYRPPEHEALVEWLDQGTNILLGRKLEARITGRYFFGAAMQDADVTWTLRRSAASYSPPGNEGFSFADFGTEEGSGWRDDRPRGKRSYRRSRGAGEIVASGSGKLGALGDLVIPVTLEPGETKRRPVAFTLEAEVVDRNRQSVAARGTLLAHRAERCLGLSLDRQVVGQGEEVDVAAVVTRIDGSRHEGAAVEVRLLRLIEEDVPYGLAGRFPDSSSKVREELVSQCSLVAGKAPSACRLKVPSAGSFVVRGMTLDLAGRPARAALRLWAWGDDMPSWRSAQSRQVRLLADRNEYVPGDTVQLLVQSPFQTATGLLLVSREGFARVEPVSVANGNARIELPAAELWMPSVNVRVVLVSGRVQPPQGRASDPGMPAFAAGDVTLAVSRAPRRVVLDVKPSSAAVEPGGKVSVTVAARDAAGKPVEAGIALMVVDEGVLSLSGYTTPDVLSALYRSRSEETCVTDTRPRVVPRTPPDIDHSKPADALKDAEEERKMDESPGDKGKQMPRAKRAVGKKVVLGMIEKDSGSGGAGSIDDAAPEFELRELFASTAYFNGGLETAADGLLSVDVKLPDNLTRFRIMAIAADRGNRFGSGESAVTTRRTLVVRPSLPRFLNFGDAFEAAAVVNNQTGFDTEVLVRCMADNAEVDGTIRRVSAKAGEAVEVRFAAKAGKPGPATFQFAVVALTSARPTDAAQVVIPTLIPATAEAFADYGVVDQSIRQPFVPPADALPQFGGLDVALSSTALTGLQDATSYLFDYPYECTEQLCSRLLPILALGDIVREFKLGKASTAEEARTLVNDGIARILQRQLGDGGFGFWPGSGESWLFLSAYAAMTLELARSKGFGVDPAVLERAADFLESRLDNLRDWERDEYAGQSMAALVLLRMGRTPKSHVDRLCRLAQGKRSTMSTEARALLVQTLAEQQSRAQGGQDPDPRIADLLLLLRNAAVETAGAAHFTASRTESLRLIMHSDDRTDAIVLSALLSAAPDDPLVEKVVRGLVRSRTHGRWSTTQANAFALLALSRYFETFEKETPNFTARLWLGETTVAASRFKGRSMEVRMTTVPMRTLLESAASDLILAKKGPGRLYYRLGLRYAPADLQSKPADYGFSVERMWLPEGDGGPLRQREDGAIVVKAGSYVRARLQVVVPDRRYFVAVVDPLPAGFEAVNEALATSATQRLSGAAGSTIDDDGRGWWRHWYYNPWDYQELRDDRVQLFADSMHEGVYEHTYLVRATTIGTFRVPPLRAEEMYSPEVFGRSSSTVVVVEP
jgi:uncharacterized protein YfaS (alpha-2-macroglobulin family)